MQERKASPKPFQNSLSALAQVALHESGADGYAFFRENPDNGILLQLDSGGAKIAPDSVMRKSPEIVTYPMAMDGILAFAFNDSASSGRNRLQLDRLAAAIESVWNAARSATQYSQLASQVADLETRLMDARIADRVRGMLYQPGATDTIDAIAKHVEVVLRPPATGRILEQLTHTLQEEVEERRLTNRAKAILQSVYGMSEEEAHMHLRRASRKSRRKLKDVAVDLIEGRSGQSSVQSPVQSPAQSSVAT